MSDFIGRLTEYRNAGYPLLYVQTHEERRVVETLTQAQIPNLNFWSSTLGFHGGSLKGTVGDVAGALLQVVEMPRESLLVFKDVSPPPVVRIVRDLLAHLEDTGKTILFMSPLLTIPVELEKDIQLLPFGLPSREDLGVILDKLVADVGSLTDLTAREAVIEASTSMTISEARNAFSLAIARHGQLGESAVRTVLNEKANTLKKSQLLHWVENPGDIANVGGFGNVKRYLNIIAPIFWNPADALKVMLPADRPRSIAFVGMPGCGKSEMAKAVARFLRIGCVRTDFGDVFASGGGKVGAAEQAITARNQLVEAMSPVEDWWDEAEKGLAGASGQSTANPWEARVAGSLLTWFEEYIAPVLVCATINKQEILPPEMISRFQKVFFVDLPLLYEREEIIKIHTAKRPAMSISASQISEAAAQMEKFSGREIRNAIQLACQIAFSAGQKQVLLDNLLEARKQIKPLAVTRARDLEAIKQWATDNDVEMASGAVEPATTGRRVKVTK